jgi:hypothetical protein
MSRQIGRELNKKWNVGAQHPLYRKNGTWYHLIERFPGALFDEHGYIVFDSKEAVENCPGVVVGKRANWLNVPEGIARLQGYIRAVGASPSQRARKVLNGVNGNHLREEISRLVAVIKHDIAVAGMEKTNVSPLRNMPNDSDVFKMLMHRWHEQKGMCSLCDKPIPPKPANKLLQMSRDRTDSANKIYDWENTRLTHLACNLGKSDATLNEWRDYLAMVRLVDCTK